MKAVQDKESTARRRGAFAVCDIESRGQVPRLIPDHMKISWLRSELLLGPVCAFLVKLINPFTYAILYHYDSSDETIDAENGVKMKTFRTSRLNFNTFSNQHSFGSGI